MENAGAGQAPLAGDAAAELSVGEIPASDVLQAPVVTRSGASTSDDDDGGANWRFAASSYGGAGYGDEQQDEEGDGDVDDDDVDDDDDDDERLLRSWSTEQDESFQRVDAQEEDEGDDEEDDAELLTFQFRRQQHVLQWTTGEHAAVEWQSAASTQESSERVEESVRAALSILNGHRGGASHYDDDEDDDDGEERGESDAEELRCGDGDGGHHEDDDDDEHRNAWQVDYGADGKPYYYDIVHEAMEARWPPTEERADADAAADETAEGALPFDGEDDAEDDDAAHYDIGHHDSSGRDANDNDEYNDHSGEVENDDDEDRGEDSEAEDDDDQNDEDTVASGDLQLQESRASESNQAQQQLFQRSNFTLSNFSTLTEGGEDEWQEAYTAKGRVYYYNRRTRESSWKKPDSFVSRQPQKQLAFSSSFSSSRGVESGNYNNTSFYSSSASVSRVNSVTRLSPETQDFLFCSFCGTKTVGAEATMAHFRNCSSHRFHRENRTDLHREFEELQCLMSEDSTLRALHYASSYPDVKPVEISSAALTAYREQASASASSPHRRSQAGERGEERVAVVPSISRRALERLVSTASARSSESGSSRRRHTSTGTASDATSSRSGQSSHASRQRLSSVGSGLYQESETCRYCGRSFAEGRLAKHEAVCPRVFGTEGSWGRGVPQQQQPTTPRASTSPLTKTGRAASFAGKKAKSTPLEKRNLVLSFKEHQATLVSCPNCQRKFAPSGAQQHIDICKSVQNRPKNPVRAMSLAMAG